MANFRSLVAASAAVLCGFAAFELRADTLVWSGTTNFNASVTISDDVELDGEVTLNISSGTVKVLGAIKDKAGTIGKLIKTGGGTLTLRDASTYKANPSSYSGGTEIKAGKINTYGSSSTTAHEAANPFGCGKIVLDRVSGNSSVLDYMGCITNDIEILGATTAAKPFLNRGGGTGVSGAVIGGGDIYIRGYTDRPDGNGGNGRLSINKSIVATNSDGYADFYFAGGTCLNLDCRVECNKLESSYDILNVNHNNYVGMFGGFYLGPKFAASNVVNAIRLNQALLYCNANNALKGSSLEFFGGRVSRTTLTKKYNTDWDVGKEINTSYLVLNNADTAYTQTIRWLKSDARNDDEPNYDIRSTATGVATLKITGEAGVTAVCSMKLGAKVALVVDGPADFVQVFSNRVHELNQPITVNSGTLRFAGTASIPALSKLSIGERGKFELAGDQQTLTVASLEIGGKEVPAGNYTAADFPQLVGSGMTITATSGSIPTPTGESVWVGGGENDSLTTAANWDGEVLPAFNCFTKLVFAKGGSSATVSDGMTVNALEFTNRTENAAAVPSLVFKGAGKDVTTLKVLGKVRVGTTFNATFKDITIVGENGGVDPSEPVYDGATTFTVNPTNQTEGSSVFRLDNAVICKPVAVKTMDGKTVYTIYAVAHTTNEFKAAFQKFSGNWMATQLGSGATLIFSGGLKHQWKNNVYGSGRLVINNKPITKVGGGDAIFGFTGTAIELNASSNYFGNGTTDQNGLKFTPVDNIRLMADFTANYAIYDSRLNFEMGKNTSYNRSLTVDIHCTTQRIVGTRTTNPVSDADDSRRSIITGEAGSLLVFENSTGNFNSTNEFWYTGGLSLHKKGAGLLRLGCSPLRKAAQKRNDATSTGTLMVTQGDLYLGEGFSWRNGPVVIGGSGDKKGTLHLAENSQLGRAQSLTITDDGIIDIPKDCTVTMCEVYVGGNLLATGEYTSASQIVGAHITGEGTLKVAPSGTYFIVK